jgi:hypothetical protein
MTRAPIRSRRTNRHGYVLPAVLLFLAVSFGAWAIVYRGSSTAQRVEEARAHRDVRSTWLAPAVAQGLRLLESGDPPTDPYACKVSLTQDGQTREFVLTFEKVGGVRWTINCEVADPDDVSPDAPASFASPPNAPAGLLALPFSSSRINLAWSNVAHETGYKVERSPNGSTGWTQIGTTATNVTNFAATGLSASTTYYFRVRATNVAGNGNYSPIASGTSQDLGSPNAPTGLTATVVNATSVKLNWTDNSTTENQFRIQRSSDGMSWSTAGNVSANVTTYTVTGLIPGQISYFRVRAVDGGSTSAYTAVVSAVPQ